MFRPALVLGLVALTAACSPRVPDSGAMTNVGSYDAYTDYRLLRDAQLAGTRNTVPAVPGRVVAGVSPVEAAVPPAQLGEPSPRARTVAGVGTVASDAGPAISDEQDFAAVSDRQTIESDAERLRRQRAAYEVVQPTAVPAREGGDGSNVVAYAIRTRNAVGQKLYRRNTLFARAKFERNCASFANADLAQEAFLAAGGPESDKLGVDPDGDGFACAWDPAPYRRLARAG